MRKLYSLMGALFGPVPSRRLRISLGIDLIPYKTCTLNCIYCECGRTTNLTVERKEFISTDKVIDELKNFLKNLPELDFVTFSGAGEPTLHTGIGKIISFLRKNYHYKVAVLTNGTLFYQKEVRESVKDADVILPSLDAGTEETFRKINRPHKEIRFKNLIEGLKLLRKEFKGEIWLEIFLVEGINDSEKEILAIKKIINEISPDKIQLNTVDRPPAEKWVKPVKMDRLMEIAKELNAEIITKFQKDVKFVKKIDDLKEEILNTLKRRPCTIEDLKEIFGIKIMELNKILRVLEKEDKITQYKGKRGTFYKIKH